MNVSNEAIVDLFNNRLIDFLLFLGPFSSTHVRTGEQVATLLEVNTAILEAGNVQKRYQRGMAGDNLLTQEKS